MGHHQTVRAAERGGWGTAGLESPCPGLRLRTVFPGDRYVERMVELFYKSDKDVKYDPELQVWCREVTEIGLLGAQDRG